MLRCEYELWEDWVCENERRNSSQIRQYFDWLRANLKTREDLLFQENKDLAQETLSNIVRIKKTVTDESWELEQKQRIIEAEIESLKEEKKCPIEKPESMKKAVEIRNWMKEKEETLIEKYTPCQLGPNLHKYNFSEDYSKLGLSIGRRSPFELGKDMLEKEEEMQKEIIKLHKDIIPIPLANHKNRDNCCGKHNQVALKTYCPESKELQCDSCQREQYHENHKESSLIQAKVDLMKKISDFEKGLKEKLKKLEEKGNEFQEKLISKKVC